MFFQVTFKAMAPRTGMQLSIASERVAFVDIVGAGCVFAADTYNSPCLLDACVDPHSEDCMQVTMEYCREHVTDRACAMFVPTFIRELNEEGYDSFKARQLRDTGDLLPEASREAKARRASQSRSPQSKSPKSRSPLGTRPPRPESVSVLAMAGPG